MILEPSIRSRIDAWLEGPFDEASKKEIRGLLHKNPQLLIDAFFQDLSFGTGGMRGVMGNGTNRMNLYTVRRATQGLANYLNKQPFDRIAVFIGYDVRHNSRAFAEEAASVFEGNGIDVFFSEEIIPTPLVSFACRHFGCQAALVITASHNPPEYNGYKVYWGDGAQIVAPHDENVLAEVLAVPLGEKSPVAQTAKIQHVGREIDPIYLAELKKLQLHPEIASDDLKIIYSPLHGTGGRIVPKALASWGFSNVTWVEKQRTPDGNFSFAPSPNPENAQALALGQQLLKEQHGDLFIATDPDADRVGVCVQGNLRLSGNQIACLLLDHICTSLLRKGEFPENSAFVKTIVTTELFRKIALHYGGHCIDVLTGFKYIAEKIREWESCFGGYQYIFGAEESLGYLFGTQVRDKDAISASCLIAEAAALAKSQNLTLTDKLHLLYQRHGVHREKLLDIAFQDGAHAMEKMQSFMKALRENPPERLGSSPVAKCEDFLLGIDGFPPSDVLRFWLEDETKVVVRPSGTEPKIKIYIEVVGTDVAECDARIGLISHYFPLVKMGHDV